MICYKGRTYCTETPHCGNTKCDRRLTDEVNYAASRAGLPIAMMDFHEDCGIYLPLRKRAKLPAGLSEAERGLAP